LFASLAGDLEVVENSSEYGSVLLLDIAKFFLNIGYPSEVAAKVLGLCL